MFLCHCSRCQKETGSAFGATVFFENAELHWTKGSTEVCHFKLDKTRKERAFCKTCGTPLPRLERDQQVVLPAGCLDDASQIEPTAHIFYDSRPPWLEKLVQTDKFDELPNS